MKLQLSYLFDTEAELRAHLEGQTRTDTAITAGEVEITAGADATVDADGMPYDPSVHSESRTLTAAGLWKAMRGKAQEAEAARAAFKAKGAGVAPPADLPAPAAMPGLPGAPAAAAMPGLPTAAVSRAPVTLEAVVTKLTDMLGRGKIANSDLHAIYTAAGATGAEQFETDETARAKLMDILVSKDV